MRFFVPRRNALPPGALQRAYVAGIDDVPFQCNIREASDGFAIRYLEEGAGRLCIPWRIGNAGENVLSTASLPPRDVPYHLPVELARGTLTRLRNELANWECLGLMPSSEIKVLLTRAQQSFSLAATRQHDLQSACDHAEATLGLARELMTLMELQYPRLAGRRPRTPGTRPLVIGVNLGSDPMSKPVADECVGTFSAVQIPLNWRQIESLEGQRDWSALDRQIAWAQSHQLPICLGPLLQLDRAHFPQWLMLWESQGLDLAELVADFVGEAVRRYQNSVRAWVCATRLNVNQLFQMAEDERMRLAMAVIDKIKESAPGMPIVLSLDQPWAEYLGRAEPELPPLYFADALLRAEPALTGAGLEINLGYTQPGTDARDLFEVGRQIDRWSGLERPLFIWLTVPSSNGVDPRAQVSARPVVSDEEGKLSLQTQSRQIEQLLTLLAAKPNVQAIFFNQLSDATLHDFAHGGLFDAQQQAKPVLATIRSVRSRWGF